jgi:hypothetical protein
VGTEARLRSTEAREEYWHIYYSDVHAGTIAIRTCNPHDEDPWEWHCGFYPGSEPDEEQNGTAATLDEARADFEYAWRVLLSNRTAEPPLAAAGVLANGGWLGASLGPCRLMTFRFF